MSDAVAESAYGALELALEQLNVGEYSPETARAVIDVVFRAFNPLMPGKEFSRTCADAIQEIEASYSPKIVRVYSLSNRDTTDVARIQMVETSVLVYAKNERKSSVQFDTRPEAYAYAMRVIDVLCRQGYALI